MSELETAAVETTVPTPAAALALPLVLVADPDESSRVRRADQLHTRGFRVAVARTPFETIVKASCLLPDLILMDSSLGGDAMDQTSELLSTCPATAHIPIVRLSKGRQVPSRVLARARC